MTRKISEQPSENRDFPGGRGRGRTRDLLGVSEALYR